MSELFYSRYELMPKGALNAVSGVAPRVGVLLRDEAGGVACLQPWVELGDASLSEELAGLASGHPLALGRRCLACMAVDGAARAVGRSVFDLVGGEVPLSHASIPEYMSEDEILALDEVGFDCAKLKAGRDVHGLIERLERVHAMLPHWMFRLDFNGVFSPSEWAVLYHGVHMATGGAVEFYEDPMPYDAEIWAQFAARGVVMALDRSLEKSPESLIRVVKPAAQCPEDFLARRMVLTSYMDHPVGQAWAAYEAARLRRLFPDRVGYCGLMTQGVYESTSFSEALGDVSPVWRAPEGVGLGFDALLDRLDWHRLS